MIQSRKGLLLALAFPVLVLSSLTLYRMVSLQTGREIVLPVSGYDPRDLLSGHYLTYRVDYGVEGICNSGEHSLNSVFVCLEPKGISTTPPENCTVYIQGSCRSGFFEAGIERFYVPEDQATHLEELIRSKAASIRASVGRDGRAQVKDLLIDGKSWKDQ
jgi:uncharacterized membrane-anchored protein